MAQPPALSYLTIYNPSLKPVYPAAPDDEDAEEQAQILFYTSRERAVSRDRMLRQVGLAKAIVNFSGLFNMYEPCSNIHSQTRRMVIFCPESGFFMHACLELAKTARLSPEKSKLKGKEDRNKDRTGNSSRDIPDTVWDYHDGSVLDRTLRTHLESGYEEFKLIHGTFASILETLGQEALELQLERFFTVWAWRCEVEDGFEFGKQLGISLHPHHESLQALLDSACFQLEDEDIPFVIIPPHVLPSARYHDSHIPLALPRQFLSMLPARPKAQSRGSSKQSTIKARSVSSGANTPAIIANGAPNDHEAPKSQNPGSSTFLGMPQMNLNMDAIDVRKWNWGALTFGRNKPSASKPSVPVPAEEKLPASTLATPPVIPEDAGPSTPEALVDMAALADAMASQAVTSNSRASSEALEPSVVTISEDARLHENTINRDNDEATKKISESDNDFVNDNNISIAISLPNEMPLQKSETSQEIPIPSLSSTNTKIPIELPVNGSTLPSQPSSRQSVDENQDVLPMRAPPLLELPKVFSSVFHLPTPAEPKQTSQRRAFFLTKDHLTFVLVRKDAEDWDESLRAALAEKAVPWLDKMLAVISVEDEKMAVADTNASAVDTLTPKDRNAILGSDGMFLSTPAFNSKAENLFNAQTLLRSDPSIVEVFTRGQHPQHWHIARREERENASGGEVYLEVMRKETSLADVDNQLTSIAKNW